MNKIETFIPTPSTIKGMQREDGEILRLVLFF
jgi:hypothetical protein